MSQAANKEVGFLSQQHFQLLPKDFIALRLNVL